MRGIPRLWLVAWCLFGVVAPGQSRGEAVGGQPGEQGLHPSTGDRLQGLGHLAHAVEEQGQSAAQAGDQGADLQAAGYGGRIHEHTSGCGSRRYNRDR